MLAPPITPPGSLVASLASQGYAVLDAPGLASLCAQPPEALAALAPHWNALAPDAYLLDGGRYRKRRHGCFVAREDGSIETTPHRAHWQPVEYNALHGGIERWFEPLDASMRDAPALAALLRALARTTSELKGARPWYVEAHAFRIDTTDGIGRPTPEGAHRDGVDLVAVVLVGREGIKGGETRVFDAAGPQGLRFTLATPWTALLLDDARVIHETTPIQRLVAGVDGHRDTLVVTFRAGGFQGPVASSD